MATEVFMPKAGMAMEEGTIVRWLIEIGDYIEMNDPIMEIETDKIVMEAESPASGVLLAKLYEDGDAVPVLTTIGYVGEKGEKVPENTAPEVQPQPDIGSIEAGTANTAEHLPQAVNLANTSEILATPYAKKLALENGVALKDVTPTGSLGEIKAGDVLKITPLARKIAEVHGVDSGQISGSGFSGKIMRNDILGAVGKASMEATRPISGMRKVIGQRMLKSHTEIPVVTQNMLADVTRLLELRKQVNENREDRISINDFIVKAVSKAVEEFPQVRTVLDGENFTTKAEVNIGVAVGLEEGLLVPVVHGANKLGLSEISDKVKELAGKARNGGLLPSDNEGGTFTISNMGMYDIHSFTPIINQPEAAILGVCKISTELYLLEGELAERKTMMLSLTFDHRILDGVSAANFQLRIKELLENPLEILL